MQPVFMLKTVKTIDMFLVRLPAQKSQIIIIIIIIIMQLFLG